MKLRWLDVVTQEMFRLMQTLDRLGLMEGVHKYSELTTGSVNQYGQGVYGEKVVVEMLVDEDTYLKLCDQLNSEKLS